MRAIRYFPLLVLIFLSPAPQIAGFQGVLVALPMVPEFIELCGFSTNRITDASSRKYFPTGWGIRLGELEDKDPRISTPYELAIALLVDPEALPVSPQGKELLARLTIEQRGLHTIFLLRDLARIHPEAAAYYRHQEVLANRMFRISPERLDEYTSEMTRLYVVEAAKDNRFFPLTVTSAGEKVLNPGIRIILDYLEKHDWPSQRTLIKLARRLSLDASLHASGSPEDLRFREFRSVIEHYPDIVSFLDSFLGTIARSGNLRHYHRFLLTGKQPMEVAKAIRDYLTQFPYEKNDRYVLPEELEREGVLDDDDFALYAWRKFKNSGVPVKILQADYGSVEPSVLCLFLDRDGWHTLTHDRGISVEYSQNWQGIPGLYYRRAVFFREVDVEKTWFKGIDDTYFPIETDDGPIGTPIRWVQSAYRRPR
jgi:hypothetical protein